MKYKSIVFITSEDIKNRGSFKEYLIRNSKHFFAYHYFLGYTNRKSYLEIYEEKRLIKRVEFPQFRPKVNVIRVLIYRLYLEYILFRYAYKGSFIIVDQPFFLLLNSVTSSIKDMKFVYWIGDYFPSNKGFIKIYKSLVDYYNKNLKYVIYISPPVQKIYLNRISGTETKGKYRSLIGLGLKRKNTKKTMSKGEIKLGFIAVIRKMKGLDLIFDFLEETKHDEIVIEVIGGGYYLEYYRKLAKEKGISSKVKFYGFVEDPAPIMKTWDIGLALYENKIENPSIYCEPTKIKDYLDFGLPVITTDATYIHKEIKDNNAGEVVSENVQSLDSAIGRIRKNYKRYLEGVKRLVDKYEYVSWYDEKFKFMRMSE